jgi:hypothetical protein
MGCKVIFLDIDGVLNSSRFFESQGFSDDADEEGYEPLSLEWWSQGIDPEAVKLVNEILTRTSAHVVISSSWRLGANIGYLRRVLQSRGFEGDIIGATPRLPGSPRGKEIAAWLQAHGSEIESFVVLDDDDDMDPVRHRQVQPSFTTGGLRPAHVEQAVEMLR